MKSKNYKIFFKKIKPIVYILGFVLSVVGSYQVYHGKFSNPLKEFVIIINSIIKLYAFTPTVSVEAPAPIAYQIAIWLAPIGTVMGLFSIFKPLYFKIRRAILSLNKEPLLILGLNDDSINFIKNSKEENYKFIIATAFENSDYDETLLELGVHNVRIDYNNIESMENKLIIQEHKLKNIKKIVSFEGEPENYAHIKSWDDMLKLEIDAYLLTEDARLKQIMQFSLDKLTMDVHYFSVEELIASKLFSSEEFSFLETHGIDNLNLENINNYKEISERIGFVHLFIIGSSENLVPILYQIANTGVTTATNKIILSFTGREATSILENLVKDIEEIDKVFEMNARDLNPRSIEVLNYAKEMNEIYPITGVIVNCRDVKDSILSLDRLKLDFSHLPIAMKINDDGKYEEVLRSFENIFDKLTYTTSREEILNTKNIIDRIYYEHAKRFNYSYNKTLSEMLGYEMPSESEEKMWSSLSNIKKESSYYQALHRETKIFLLEKISKSLSTTSQMLLESWREKLEGKNISEQVDVIESDPIMNFMCALEHRRWDNFYFMRHFKFNKIKDESRRIHDCLITDWDEFLNSNQRDKAIYDFLSTLDILHEYKN